MALRIRLPELLKEHHTTAYRIAKRSEGRIDASTLYRLKRADGRVRYLDAELLEAICEVLGAEIGDVLERDRPGGGRRKR